MKKALNIIQIPIKLLLVLLITLNSYAFLNSFFSNSNKNIVKEKQKYGDSFHSLDNNVLDVIVLGSSHTQYSFIPTLFYEQTGLYSYNLGTMCQPLEVSYEMLKEAFKTQSPKLVILETFTALPLRELCEANSCYITAAYAMTGEERNNTLKYLPEEKRNEYINEFMNNHNNWKNIDTEDFSDYTEGDGEDILTDFGFVEQIREVEPENWWYAVGFEGNAEVELDELDLKSLNNILDLCKNKHAELLLYKTPIDGFDENNRNYLNMVWKWADENNVKYIDYLTKDEEMNFYMNYQSDGFHCYIDGAADITMDLCKFVKNNYYFEHKKIDKYEKLFTANEKQYYFDILNSEYNPLKYLEILANAKKGTVLVKVNNCIKIPKELLKKLNKITGCYLKEVDCFYGVIEGRKLVAYSYGDELVYKNIKISDNIIMLNDFVVDSEMSQLSVVYLNENDFVLKNILFKNNGYYWDVGKTYYIR